MPHSLTVIVLNWNNATDTLTCLESLARQEYPHRVLVVDNGSTDDSVARIRAAFPEVEILETGENLGYAGGNNVGIRYALAQGAEYLLILNNDVVLAPDCLSRLMEALETHPEVEIASPLIANMADGETIWALGQYVNRRTGTVSRYAAGESIKKWHHREPFQITAISGTAWLASRKALETIGLLDEQFFLYYEETDWSLQASRHGYTLWVVPDAILWHKVSATLGTTSPIVDYYMTRNYFRFIARHWRGIHRIGLLSIAVLRQLGTVAAYTVKPHHGQRTPHRDARLLALRDATFGRWGKVNHS